MRYFIIILLLSRCMSANAQHTTWTVKMTGFVFTMQEGKLYFQPSADSNAFLESLDSTLIILGTDNFTEQDNLQKFCQGVGDSFSVQCNYRYRDKWDRYTCNISYFYCDVELTLFMFGLDILTLGPVNHYFVYNKERYDVRPLWIRNRTEKLIPKRKKDWEGLIDNYKKAGIFIPIWLRNLY